MINNYMKYITIVLILVCHLSHAQNKRRYPGEAYKGSFIISGQASYLHYNKSSQLYYSGIRTEWFFGEHMSLRGGFFNGPRLTRVSTAPLMWLCVANTKKFNIPDQGIKTFLVLLSLCDGITYNIPVSKKLFVTPYIAPWQANFIKPLNPGEKLSLNNMFAIGTGLKYMPRKTSFTFDVNAEYALPYRPVDIQKGFSINATIGYRIKPIK